MTIARDGLKEIAVSTVIIGGLTGLSVWAAWTVSAWLWIIVAPLAALWAFSVLFFRVPNRRTPATPNIMVAPADGRVTEITRLEGYEGIGRPALRIGIFLSVFDVHVNRSPCDGRVISARHQPGEFLDARHPECGIRNESNTVVINPVETGGPIIVRQIAGLIARRIVCHLKPGDSVTRGQQFGLIKFGSRTELIVPLDSGLEAAVRIGQHVKGGATILMVSAKTKTASEDHPQPESQPQPRAAVLQARV